MTMDGQAPAGSGLDGFDRTIPRRSICNQRIEQFVGDGRDLIDRSLESDFVDFGWSGETAQLPDKLKGRRSDFLIGRRRREIMQCFDVSTHGVESGVES